LVFRYLDSFPRPEGFPVWPELPPAPTVDELKAGANAAASCVGDPDEISRTVQRFIDVGADQLTFPSPVCDSRLGPVRGAYGGVGQVRSPPVRPRPGAFDGPPAPRPVRELGGHALGPGTYRVRPLPSAHRPGSCRVPLVALVTACVLAGASCGAGARPRAGTV